MTNTFSVKYLCMPSKSQSMILQNTDLFWQLYLGSATFLTCAFATTFHYYYMTYTVTALVLEMLKNCPHFLQSPACSETPSGSYSAKISVCVCVIPLIFLEICRILDLCVFTSKQISQYVFPAILGVYNLKYVFSAILRV